MSHVILDTSSAIALAFAQHEKKAASGDVHELWSRHLALHGAVEALILYDEVLLDGPVRSELGPYCGQIARLIHKTTRPDSTGLDREWVIWSITHVDDLRGRGEREP
jgi:hypothetical protein